jgi:antitoxin YefM
MYEKTYVFKYGNEVSLMIAVKSMDVRDNFKLLCDKVFGGETLIISRPKNENIVMLSEKEYNDLQKAKRNAEYLAMLNQSAAEAEAGNFVVKTIEELEAYE